MLKQYDSETSKSWELEVYNAEEVAEMGEHANTIKQYFDDEPDLNLIHDKIKEINEKNGNNFDTFELIEIEQKIKRYVIE